MEIGLQCLTLFFFFIEHCGAIQHISTGQVVRLTWDSKLLSKFGAYFIDLVGMKSWLKLAQPGGEFCTWSVVAAALTSTPLGFRVIFWKNYFRIIQNDKKKFLKRDQRKKKLLLGIFYNNTARGNVWNPEVSFFIFLNKI